MLQQHFYQDKNVSELHFYQDNLVKWEKKIIFAVKTKEADMYRNALQQMLDWKASVNRKPLIIRGARQTGKTWLMKEFGRQAFQNVVYINFENESRFRNLFANDYDTTRILATIQLYYGKPIDAATTLIIFDEIQAVDGGIASLKYFSENAPEYAIVAAGSLLGISLHPNNSFPVGKVVFLDLSPLSFSEFLIANGKELLLQTMQRGHWDLLQPFHNELLDLLRIYFVVGGMPEVVQCWIDSHDFSEVRNIQYNILRSYQADFSKHAPHEQVPRLDMVWSSLPTQLSKENKKFVYGVIREGARAKDFELAIMWLCNSGLVLKSHRVSVPHMPLCAYHDMQVFKLFMIDVGLLGAFSGLDVRTMIDGNDVFSEFKGALAEQFVMQELVTLQLDYIGYWTNERSTSEVDFLIQRNGQIVPIEVKSGENLRSRSFTLFCQNYAPSVAIKTSTLPYHSGETIQNVPLYGLSSFLSANL